MKVRFHGGPLHGEKKEIDTKKYTQVVELWFNQNPEWYKNNRFSVAKVYYTLQYNGSTPFMRYEGISWKKELKTEDGPNISHFPEPTMVHDQ